MSEDVRICFVGDSFVNGTGDETALGWVGRLCAAAHSLGIPVSHYNLGIRRNTSKDILLRWETECERRLPESCDGRIVFSFGVNDTTIDNGAVRIHPEESRSNTRKILRTATRCELLMVGPPPVADDVQNERIERISEVLAEESNAFDVPYIDLFYSLKSDVAYKQEVRRNDGSHPRSTGYAKISATISSSSSWWFHAP